MVTSAGMAGVACPTVAPHKLQDSLGHQPRKTWKYRVNSNVDDEQKRTIFAIVNVCSLMLFLFHMRECVLYCK